jgi:hypothetical protein
MRWAKSDTNLFFDVEGVCGLWREGNENVSILGSFLGSFHYINGCLLYESGFKVIVGRAARDHNVIDRNKVWGWQWVVAHGPAFILLLSLKLLY